ncbi:phage recombination protein Bet [Kozakia baliensis]|uniref:phage recombination protein Bet n=1 Tax=Kozakia baliensis TaxID=153496 RepID=UPI00345BB37B
MNAVAKTSTQMDTVTERDLMDTLKNSLYPGASDASVQMVLGYCRAAGLDVMKKPVHIVPIWSKAASSMVDTIMPGIALYRIDAARTGEYLGKSEPEFGPIRTMKLGGVDVRFPEWCKVTVRRLVSGHVCEFTALEFWLENYATAKRDTDAPNAMWKKRAFGQLAKCAEAQALRMAFPEQTGGTNTNDEMEGKTFDAQPIDITPQAKPDAPRIPQMPNYVAQYKRGLAQAENPERCIAARTKWIATVAEAEESENPIPSDVQNTVMEMIDKRQDELAAIYGETHEADDLEQAPA